MAVVAYAITPPAQQSLPAAVVLGTICLAISSSICTSPWIKMKHFLFLAAAAGFLPGLIIRICKVSYDSVLTDSLAVQKEIIDLHNTIRRAVDPPASNMLKMSWNNEAANNARELAKHCDVVQSNALKRRIANTFCGENMYLTPYPITWTEVIGIWHNESKNFEYGVWSSTEDEQTVDHYTQIIWSSSYLIGCGVSSCCKKLTPQFLYVCHYCHEGNEPELKGMPYMIGDSCEDCPNDCDNKLCTNPCTYYDEYIDCDIQKVVPGCRALSVTLQCKATCLCTTEIK
ncbi:cysteine-rich secretory protein 1 [Myotis daubentonii]|uniref:cysteine-rich secretory protein 1 n=1 Tax=Myotis daubentonii TaxID=98922 RepID=UPI002872B05A|nr:cysteine-rich secretory protein 1 [Myotis daubentonii]